MSFFRRSSGTLEERIERLRAKEEALLLFGQLQQISMASTRACSDVKGNIDQSNAHLVSSECKQLLWAQTQVLG